MQNGNRIFFEREAEMQNFNQVVFQDEDENQRIQPSQYNKAVLKSMARKSPLSLGMLAILFLMFILCILTDLVQDRSQFPNISSTTLVKYGANYSILVKNQHEYYRLFTAMFLHAGFMHLIMNSVSYFLYLMPTEARLNKSSLFLFVLLWGGMLGNMLSLTIYDMKGKTLLAIGASTSICSVIGFDLCCRLLQNSVIPVRLRRVGITLLTILLISLIPGVDFWGHFGSLIGGCLIGMSFFDTSSFIESGIKRNIIKYIGRISLVAYSFLLIWGVTSNRQRN